ncbi:MAG: M48 family metallopeptidase [Chitinophagales bacterium]|nr:M48 family metallopeptidase [Chitinophagales bacterium]MCZ2394356.1 M48 family metallopeptidase [Chitinophagales bacterium]
MKKVYITLLISAIVYACSQVPVTGRKQINLVADSEMNAMSLASYKEFLTENKSKVLTSGPQVDIVKKVGNKTALAVEQYMKDNKMESAIKNFQWEFNVVQDNTVNAWCMPGGKVVVYTGILNVAKTEAELAVVIGHEIAHAVAKHGSERMSQGLLQEFGGAVLSQALAQKSELTQNLFMTAYGVGSNLLGVLPYSRLHESEADKLGLIFMAIAGYNPEAAISFWQQMAAGNKNSSPEFLSTHPSDNTRINQIKEYLPTALKYYKGN